MTARDDFNRTVSDWLDEKTGRRAPDYLDAVLARTSRTRQRPAWSSLERWLPVQSTFSGRIAPMGRLAWSLVAIALIVLAATVLLLAGVGQRRLPHFGSAANGAILFVDGTDLKIAGADGAKVRTAGTLPAGIESLTFSPDGLRLAYRTTGTPASIVIADADGTNPLDVTIGATVAASAQVATGGPFAWSPNSKQLAFARNVAAGQRTIDLVNADGSHLTQLVPDPPSGPSDSYDPAWSPDGAWISYFATEPAGFVGINVIRPDGRDARRLPTSVVNPDDVEMSWSPDPAQSRLAYVTGGYVKIFDLVTNADTVVGDGYWASWSPDAQRIAWWSGGTWIARVDDVLANQAMPVRPFPLVNSFRCSGHWELAGKAICAPARWSPDGAMIFGIDVTGTSIVFARVDGASPPRTVGLDHPIDLANGPRGQVAWQPVAP
jgi:hypothetical protein